MNLNFRILFPIIALFILSAYMPARAADSSTLQTISTEDMLKLLRSPKKSQPLILHVGPHILYQQAHIPGSDYAGQGSTPQGIDKLRRRVAFMKKNTHIILYCGCCPWNHCPNVNPAYDALKQLGFSNVKVLYIPGNFGVDWVDKGYPVASGD